MRTKKQLQKAVERGAERLTAELPSWRERVQPAGLDLKDPRYCVLGHVYKRYEEGCARLGLVDHSIPSSSSERNPARFGFSLSYTESSQEFDKRNRQWDLLSETWVECLERSGQKVES